MQKLSHNYPIVSCTVFDLVFIVAAIAIVFPYSIYPDQEQVDRRHSE